jgi:hypothetical protein
MKVIHAFAQIFAIFSFLTLGSLMMIVAFHILTVDDAVLKLRAIYHSPWQSMRIGFIGFLFIMIGLQFSKTLVKKGKQTDAIILHSENGPVLIAIAAVEDVIKKVVKHFNLIKENKTKIIIHNKVLQAKMRLVLWSGGKVPELLNELQSEIRGKLLKLLGDEIQLEINCDVQRIEDHEAEPVLEEVTEEVLK